MANATARIPNVASKASLLVNARKINAASKPRANGIRIEDHAFGPDSASHALTTPGSSAPRTNRAKLRLNKRKEGSRTTKPILTKAADREFLIQKLKYNARGYRNRERFRNAIYFHLGGLDLYPDSLN